MNDIIFPNLLNNIIHHLENLSAVLDMSEASIDFKNSVPFGLFKRKLSMVFLLPLVHPSLLIVQQIFYGSGGECDCGSGGKEHECNSNDGECERNTGDGEKFNDSGFFNLGLFTLFSNISLFTLYTQICFWEVNYNTGP